MPVQNCEQFPSLATLSATVVQTEGALDLTADATKPAPAQVSDYPFHMPIQTRWMDNDVYGHVNNVTYYSYFDTAVNGYLIGKGALDIEKSPVIGLVVETSCRYRAPLTFPESITAGIRVARLGTSSVRYEIGLFRACERDAAAEGHFIHVYVDRSTRRPVPLPAELKAALLQLVVR
jgi:acyl-CoA thioester hydrolase